MVLEEAEDAVRRFVAVVFGGGSSGLTPAIEWASGAGGVAVERRKPNRTG